MNAVAYLNAGLCEGFDVTENALREIAALEAAPEAVPGPAGRVASAARREAGAERKPG